MTHLSWKQLEKSIICGSRHPPPIAPVEAIDPDKMQSKDPRKHHWRQVLTTHCGIHWLNLTDIFWLLLDSGNTTTTEEQEEGVCLFVSLNYST